MQDDEGLFPIPCREQSSGRRTPRLPLSRSGTHDGDRIADMRVEVSSRCRAGSLSLTIIDGHLFICIKGY
jgi:hypothetical protein